MIDFLLFFSVGYVIILWVKCWGDKTKYGQISQQSALNKDYQILVFLVQIFMM